MKLAKRIWMAAICVAGLALPAGAQSVSITYSALSEPLPDGTTKYFSLTVDAGGGSATTKYLKTVKSSGFGGTSGNLSVYEADSLVDAHLSIVPSWALYGAWSYTPMGGDCVETWTIQPDPSSPYVAIADLTDIPAKFGVVDLAGVSEHIEAQDGAVLTGTLGGSYRISVAAGASVTISNAVVQGEGNEDFEWAGVTCLGDAT